MAGFDVVRDAVRLRPVIGLAGQFAAVDENLTGLENLRDGRSPLPPPARPRPGSARRRCSSGSSSPTPRIGPPRPTRAACGAGSTSARASSAGPKVLFMDEPTTGLDPRSRLVLWELIRDLQKEGTTLLLCTQYLEEADQPLRSHRGDRPRDRDRRGNVGGAEGQDRRRGSRAARRGGAPLPGGRHAPGTRRRVSPRWTRNAADPGPGRERGPDGAARDGAPARRRRHRDRGHRPAPADAR